MLRESSSASRIVERPALLSELSYEPTCPRAVKQPTDGANGPLAAAPHRLRRAGPGSRTRLADRRPKPTGLCDLTVGGKTPRGAARAKGRRPLRRSGPASIPTYARTTSHCCAGGNRHQDLTSTPPTRTNPRRDHRELTLIAPLRDPVCQVRTLPVVIVRRRNARHLLDSLPRRGTAKVRSR